MMTKSVRHLLADWRCDARRPRWRDTLQMRRSLGPAVSDGSAGPFPYRLLHGRKSDGLLVPYAAMAHKNEPEIPLALEGVAARLDELRTVLGTAVTPALDGVRAALIDAMAARDRGDRAGCVRHIGTAMDRLAAL